MSILLIFHKASAYLFVSPSPEFELKSVCKQYILASAEEGNTLAIYLRTKVQENLKVIPVFLFPLKCSKVFIESKKGKCNLHIC